MELNDNTLSVLKNYADINSNIYVEQGSTIKTMAEARNVISSATLDQEFPASFGIYNLPEFLGVLNLVDTPKLEFDDNYVVVSDSNGRSKIKYFFSDKEMLTTPTKDLKMPESEVTFKLDESTLQRIRRAASTLGHEKMTITPAGEGVVRLSVVDTASSTSNSFVIDVPGSYDEDVNFSFIMNIANIKVIAGDYDVGISSKLISQFVHEEGNIKYYIALEKASTYGV